MKRATFATSSAAQTGHRLLRWSSTLLACGLCGAFLSPPSTTFSLHQARSRSATPVVSWERQAMGTSASLGVRMPGALDDELQAAVRGLASQIDDLTVIVRQIAEQAPWAKTESSEQINLNGAAVGKDAAVPVVAFSGGNAKRETKPTGLVRTEAALERIDMWLKEQGLETKSAPAERPSVALSAANAAVEVAPATSTETTSDEDGYKITIDWDGATHEMRCPSGSTLLDAATDVGIDLPHSCMAGSCFTCPGKIVSGSVDQSDGVLEDEQIEAGYLLTCVSYPLSDVHFTVIAEEDLP